MANHEVKSLMKDNRISYWKLGDILGIHENTVLRKLRHELSKEERERFIAAIEEIKAQKETA